jgi:hypothetical protein
MSFDRAAVPGGEPVPAPATEVGSATERSPEPISPAMRLQILSTEHWSLLASRSLAWSEAFSRAGMFLSTLSGAFVALALVAQASAFGEGFRLFGLVILPVVLLVGIGTLLRMGISNYHDAMCVVGMNRIRAGYLEMAPELERFFVMGTTDDHRGIALTMAARAGTPMPIQMLASTPMLVTILDAILLGAIVALLVLQLGGSVLVALVLAAVGFIGLLGFFAWYARRDIERVAAELSPRFGPDGQADEPDR